MDGFLQISEVWLNTLQWMAGLAVFFAIAEQLMPCNPGMYWWKDRRALLTDLIYWFVVPLFIRVFRVLMLYTAVGLVFRGADTEFLTDFFRNGYGPLSGMPMWAQCVGYMVLADIMLYWIHRLFHQNLGWRYHAVHHSPKVLDWVSTQRFHPVNNLLAFNLVDVVILLMGFSPQAMLILAPFNIFYSTMVHANLNWTFGPLRYVFASPVFHRWHHTTADEGGSKNFAPTFPILDVMFGTFYMPKGKLPEHYGVDDKEFPEGFWGQFMYPFRKQPRR